MEPEKLRKELTKQGYLARQNRTAGSLFLNLGGPESEIDRGNGFKGAILLFVKRHLVVGVCPNDIRDFRDLVMEHRGDDRWTRRRGIPGGRDSTVTLWLCNHSGEEKAWRLCCKVGKGKRISIRIPGFVRKLDIKTLKRIEEWAYLKEFENFCIQEDTE